MRHHFVTVALACLLTACVAEENRATQSFSIATTPEGASCTVRRGELVLGQVASTPGTTTITRATESIRVTCVAPGHQDLTVEYIQAATTQSLGVALLFGPLGSMAQAGTGANVMYPERVSLELAPASFPTAAARDQWFDRVLGEIDRNHTKAIGDHEGSCTLSPGLCQAQRMGIEQATARLRDPYRGQRERARIGS
jgi:hypothetical protein